MTAPLDRERWAAARVLAVTRMPYLASALFALPVGARPGIATVAVNPAWQLYADPDVVDSWSVEELGRVLLHLLGHLLRDHAARAADAPVTEDDRSTWVLAADSEINDDLVGLDLLPASAPDLPGDWGCWPGRLAEAYVDHLLEHPAARRGTLDCGSGCDGLRRPWEGEGGLPDWLRKLLGVTTATAACEHQGLYPGSVPGGWLRWAEGVLRPVVDWRKVLAGEIRRAVASVAGSVDYTYRRPSRRAGTSPGVILPSLHHPVPEVAVVCDTSGSMSADLLQQALAEIDGLMLALGRRRQVPVLACDTAVHTVQRATGARQVTLVGGGGTDMGVGINAAMRLRPRPNIVVVLTDGFTPWPDRPPSARVVVGLIGARGARHSDGLATPNWTRTVDIEEVDKARPL